MAVASKKNNLKKDDIVEVVKGKERGKKGKILTFSSESGRVTVEKLICLKGILSLMEKLDRQELWRKRELSTHQM